MFGLFNKKTQQFRSNLHHLNTGERTKLLLSAERGLVKKSREDEKEFPKSLVIIPSVMFLLMLVILVK